MKIFSLESKKNVLVWSVVLGLIINAVISKYTFSTFTGTWETCPQPNPYIDFPVCSYWGWPLQISNMNLKLELINYIFWILIFYLILGLLSHFRHKKGVSYVKN